MKFFAIVAMIFMAATSAFAQTVTTGSQGFVGVESFLSQNYGWTIDFSKQERSFFGFNWDLNCSTAKPVLPKEGVNTFYGTPCLQKDKAYYTAIMWRVPSTQSLSVEKLIFNGMSDGMGYGKVTCNEEAFPSAVAEKGIIRDCAVPLGHGTFFVSFYHFDLPMPPGGSFVDNEGVRAEKLSYTIWVQNADSVSHAGVPEKIRKLVSWIRKP